MLRQAPMQSRPRTAAALQAAARATGALSQRVAFAEAGRASTSAGLAPLKLASWHEEGGGGFSVVGNGCLPSAIRAVSEGGWGCAAEAGTNRSEVGKLV